MGDEILLPKTQLIHRLEKYDNLIAAMAALFYLSKKMTGVVPCSFAAWREITNEKRAERIHEMLS
jgi:hypothetical protein